MVLYGVVISMINGEIIRNEWIVRYVTGHPVSLFTTAMFCIGTAALVLVGKNIFDQNWARKKLKLTEPEDLDLDSWNSEEKKAMVFADQLLLMPKKFREFYLWQRLNHALEYVRRNHGTEDLEDELKYVAETEADRQSERFALVRILIWATPMLGFLGTVLGISQALGSINVGVDNDFQQMLGGLRESLYVAFDTTALALTFSIILMFGQFVVDRFDTQLLESVDSQCRNELEQHFELLASRKDPDTRVLEKVGRQISSSVEQSSNQQIEIWNESMLQANEQWLESAKELNQQWVETHEKIQKDDSWQAMHEHWDTIQDKWSHVHQDLLAQWNSESERQQSTWAEATAQIQQKMVNAMDSGCEKIENGLGKHLADVSEQMEHRWQQLQVSISESARMVQDQQAEMRTQSEAMIQAMKEVGRQLQPNEQDREVDRKVDEIAESMQTLGNAMVESTQRLAESVVAQQNNQSVIDAIHELKNCVVQQSEILSESRNQPAAEDVRLNQLADVVEQLGTLVAESRQKPEPAPNQELKLRIIRPAA